MHSPPSEADELGAETSKVGKTIFGLFESLEPQAVMCRLIIKIIIAARTLNCMMLSVNHESDAFERPTVIMCDFERVR